MVDLFDYIDDFVNESAISNNALMYRIGVSALNDMQRDNAKKLLRKYKINGENNRSKIIKYARANYKPLLKTELELISRSEWDLESLYGETEAQLMHPVYHDIVNLIFKDKKTPKDILTVFQCSLKKPYYDNRLFKYEFINLYSDYTDFAVISNPGTIPLDYSNYYPYRWDDWSNKRMQKIRPIVDIEHKDTVVNTCRFLRYVREMGYKHVIVYIANPMEQEMFEDMIKHNVAGAKDWLHIAIHDGVRNKVAEEKPGLEETGFINIRITGQKRAKESYKRILQSLVGEKDKKAIRDIFKNKYEAQSDSKWQVLKDLDYDTIKKRFVKYWENRKEDKDFLYKNHYFSGLDILIVGLDGNFVENVDEVYWNMMDRLKKDKDFENFDDFLFAYNKAKKEDPDNHDIKKFHDEAMRLVLIQKRPGRPKLRIKL